MNNNINDFIYKNDLLASIKDLLAKYEDSIKLYEKTIAQLESSVSTTIIKCSQIVAYNNTDSTMHWDLLDLNGNLIYKSDNYLKWQTWVLNLDDTLINSGDQFKLKAIVGGGDDSESSEIIQYESSSNTIYYELSGTIFNTQLKYLSQIPSPDSPPVIQCYKMVGDNTVNASMNWEFLNLNNISVYSSSKVNKDSSATIFLSDADLTAGERIKVKAALNAANDSIGYFILEYQPSSTTAVHISVLGDKFQTVVYYKGTTQ